MSKKRAQRISFMKASDVKHLRVNVLKQTVREIAKVLYSPNTGKPVMFSTVCKWELGALPVPLWASRALRRLVVERRENHADAAIPVPERNIE